MLQGVADALGALLKRIADFFDLFDLSFFVAGGAALGALLYVAVAADVEFQGEVTALTALGGALAVYCLGLGCFAAGRVLRRPIVRRLPNGHGGEDYTERFEARLYEAVRDHGLLEDEIVGPYVAQGRAPKRLYTRLWAELRGRAELAESYELLRRFWVLAATCDGVAFASMIWAGALTTVAFTPELDGILPPAISYGLSGGFVLFAVACWHEASRFGKSQLEESVATVAFLAQLRAEAKEASAPPDALAEPAEVV